MISVTSVISQMVEIEKSKNPIIADNGSAVRNVTGLTGMQISRSLFSPPSPPLLNGAVYQYVLNRLINHLGMLVIIKNRISKLMNHLLLQRTHKIR